MDKVICKIMTINFQEKFNIAVQKEAEQKLCTKYDVKNISEIDAEKINVKTFLEIEKIRIQDSFYFMWNNSESLSYHKQHDVKNSDGTISKFSVADYYKELGLWKPETTEQIFNVETIGLQSKIRIMWNNEITKLDDINEIISYKLKVID